MWCVGCEGGCGLCGVWVFLGRVWVVWCVGCEVYELCVGCVVCGL